MLSRVAENIYWLGRYLERAENVARLLIATTHMLLDAPRNTLAGTVNNWQTLIIISGSNEIFQQTGEPANAETVMPFMATNRDNPSSILSSLFAARENLRTTRDSFPKKAMEYLNAMYLGFQQRMEEGGHDEGMRYMALDQVIQDSQKITGLLFSTMSRDSAFEFFRMGQNLERADMTTRILDVGAVGVSHMARDTTLIPFINSVWLNTLRSLSGEQMYRRHVHPRIKGASVVAFLLTDKEFPRSFRRCLIVVDGSLSRLNNNEPVSRTLEGLQNELLSTTLEPLLEKGELPLFLDRLQIGLGRLHAGIAASYFPQAMDPQMASQ